ncbi:MAG: magnesium transporter CorA [Alphaproteobacteria bacterium]|nr:MAG: magnesium transporter CorA [Alphaproteobacteria bacterium]
MLILHSRAGDICKPPEDLGRAALPADIVWIDLLQPSAEESAFVERTTALKLPSLADLSEIEASSRLRTVDGTLYLSAPLVYRAAADDPQSTPVGFILTAQHFVTVRFETPTAFTTAAQRMHPTPHEAFACLMDAIVDRIADILERISAELDNVSHRLFRAGPVETGSNRRPARAAADLRVILRRIGRSGDLASKIRDSLLGIGRIVPYVENSGAVWLTSEAQSHLRTLRQDIYSLSQYDEHLTNKLQLLLDATLGMINIDQNNIIKVLTIVSVVGVPPTLVASMYGMNFHNMPELDWSWGYPYALALIALTAVAPLLWFKWRGWF